MVLQILSIIQEHNLRYRLNTVMHFPFLVEAQVANCDFIFFFCKKNGFFLIVSIKTLQDKALRIYLD